MFTKTKKLLPCLLTSMMFVASLPAATNIQNVTPKNHTRMGLNKPNHGFKKGSSKSHSSCKKSHKVDPLVGAWNGYVDNGVNVTNFVVHLNSDGTSVGESDVDIGVATPAIPAPPGFRVTLSTGTWKKIGHNRYRLTDSNILVQQGAAYGTTSIPLFRIKKTIEFTLSKINGSYELNGTIVFSTHLISDLTCETPIQPPTAPATLFAKKLAS